jgi:tetratricopeptide (TPR) repeat protein
MSKGTRNAIGYGIVAFLVGLGILVFFILQNRIVSIPPAVGGHADSTLQDGINQYRKGEYEQARLFLTRVINASWDRRAKSTASLYLGNIAYREDAFKEAVRLFKEAISLDDENLFAYYNAALVLIENGDVERARKYAKEAMLLWGEDSRAGLLLANIYFSEGKLHKASQLYSKQTEESGISRYNLAFTLLHDNRRAESLVSLQEISSGQNGDALLKALSSHAAAGIASDLRTDTEAPPVEMASTYMRQAYLMFGSHPSVFYNHALLLLHEGRYEEAIDLLQSGRLDPALEHLIGYALYAHGDYSEALPIWERLFADNDADARIARILGDIHYHLENWEEAVEYYQAAVRSGQLPEAYGSLVQAYVHTGDYEKALKACEVYVEAAEDDLEPLLCLADLYFYTGPRKRAMSALEKAVKLVDDDEQGLESVAELYAKHGMYNSALRLYGEILSDNPERRDIHGRIAELYLLTGHESRAREELQLLLKHEENSDILYNAEILLARIEGGLRGRERLEQLSRDFPDRFEAFYNMAVLLYQEGEYQESLEILEGYLEQEQRHGDKDASLMHTLSGVASARLGMDDRAALHFSRAVELDRNNELAVLNLKLIQEYPL